MVQQLPPTFPPKRKDERGANFYSPGARDLLPLGVAQKRWIEERLRPVLERWGYHRIITSTLERLDTLMAGGAIQQSTVIQLQDTEDEMTLGLRPEVTASIARAAVTRMAGATYPLRLYYNTNVFRRCFEGSHGGQQEFYQAGVELLGASGVVADAEVLLLLSECLQSLGLKSWRVILGEAGLTRSLLSPFPPGMQERVRRAIAHLDRIALETLPLSPEQRQRALFLFELRGRPGYVLQRVATLDLDSSGLEALENLKSLVDLIEESFVSPSPLLLDLSLIQPLDYYTGIVFQVVSDTEAEARILGQGGRYDQLLSLYHPQGVSIPGIGFALNIEDLHQVLLPTGQLPSETPASDWLVVPLTPKAYAAAFAIAQKLRETGDKVRVEVDLHLSQKLALFAVTEGTDSEQLRAVREYARSRRITQIAWVKGLGEQEIETLT